MSTHAPLVERIEKLDISGSPTMRLMQAHINAEAERQLTGEPVTHALIASEMVEMRDCAIALELERDRLQAVNAELVKALELAERNTASVVYMLPIGRSAERQSRETELAIYRAALARAKE